MIKHVLFFMLINFSVYSQVDPNLKEACDRKKSELIRFYGWHYSWMEDFTIREEAKSIRDQSLINFNQNTDFINLMKYAKETYNNFNYHLANEMIEIETKKVNKNNLESIFDSLLNNVTQSITGTRDFNIFLDAEVARKTLTVSISFLTWFKNCEEMCSDERWEIKQRYMFDENSNQFILLSPRYDFYDNYGDNYLLLNQLLSKNDFLKNLMPEACQGF